MISDKNRDRIEVSDNILVSSCSYRLIGSVHHHGRTIASGHYTSNIWYPDSAYLCNDAQILPLKNFKISDSVHMLFYARHESNAS